MTGVEPNPRLRELAAERSPGLANVEFVEGLAAELPLPDRSVDLLWCEQVLQHLSDPAQLWRSLPACCARVVGR